MSSSFTDFVKIRTLLVGSLCHSYMRVSSTWHQGLVNTTNKTQHPRTYFPFPAELGFKYRGAVLWGHAVWKGHFSEFTITCCLETSVQEMKKAERVKKIYLLGRVRVC